MSISNLCFGPYNDPGWPSGSKHYNLPHDFSCLNPAFVVRKSGHTYTVQVAVRNVSSQVSPSDITVSLFGRTVPSPLSSQGLDSVVTNMFGGHPANIITGQTTFMITTGIAPYSSANDYPWMVGPVIFTPLQPKGVVLAATLSSATWGLAPTPGTLPTHDPCVAVWVGP